MFVCFEKRENTEILYLLELNSKDLNCFTTRNNNYLNNNVDII